MNSLQASRAVRSMAALSLDIGLRCAGMCAATVFVGLQEGLPEKIGQTNRSDSGC